MTISVLLFIALAVSISIIVKRKEESDNEPKNYLVFRYSRGNQSSLSSRESSFSSDFDYFIKVHNIADPGFFAMQCIKAGMEAYDQAIKEHGAATIDNASIKLRVSPEGLPSSSGVYVRF